MCRVRAVRTNSNSEAFCSGVEIFIFFAVGLSGVYLRFAYFKLLQLEIFMRPCAYTGDELLRFPSELLQSAAWIRPFVSRPRPWLIHLSYKVDRSSSHRVSMAGHVVVDGEHIACFILLCTACIDTPSSSPIRCRDHPFLLYKCVIFRRSRGIDPNCNLASRMALRSTVRCLHQCRVTTCLKIPLDGSWEYDAINI
jgi:hypothetical protein